MTSTLNDTMFADACAQLIWMMPALAVIMALQVYAEINGLQGIKGQDSKV